MAGYSRQANADIIPTAVVRAAPINSELNALRDAFAASGGHKHDGTSTEGAYVPLIADVDGNNKVSVNTGQNRVEFYSEVGATSVAQLYVQDGAVLPVTDNDIDLGSASAEFKDLFLDGTAKIDTLVVDENASITGTLSVTGALNSSTILSSGGITGNLTGNVTGNLTGNVTGNVTGDVTGNVSGNVTSTGTSTFSNINVDGGTVDGTVVGGTTPSAVTGTVVTATTQFTGDVVGNVTGNVTGSVTGDLTGDVTGDLSGNVTAATGTSTFNDVTVNGTLDVTGTTIANVTDPVNPQDAATKNYVDSEVAALVDTAPGTLDTLNELAAALGDDPDFATTVTDSIATKLPLAGGTMSGAIAMGTNKITGVGDPVANQDAATKAYVDTQDATKLSLSGGTMTGNIVMGGNKVTSTATPTADDDLTRKGYVDGILGSATSAADSAAAAAVSETNAGTSETNAAISETNAADSAAAAAISETNAAASATEAQGYADSINPDNIDINGGTIDGTSIGQSTPAAAAFTSVTASGSFTSGSQYAFSDGTVSGVFGSGTSDMNIATTSNHAIDIRPNNTRSMLLFPNGTKTFYKSDGSTPGVTIDGNGKITTNANVDIGDGAAANSIADNLTISKDTDNIGMSILCADATGFVRFYLGSQTDIQAAKLQHNENNDELTLQAKGNLVLQSGGTTDRVVVDDSGGVGIGAVANNAALDVTETSATKNSSMNRNTNASFSSNVIQARVTRSASSSYNYLRAVADAGGTPDTAFLLSGDGNGTCDGSWTGGGADYAEYFEWDLAHLEWVTQWKAQKGHIAGISVVLAGNKIRPAELGEEPIGVISANPSVVGDGDIDRWKEKYLRDDFGAYIWEDYEVLSWTEVVTEVEEVEEQGAESRETSKEVQHSYAEGEVPADVEVPLDAARVTQKRKKLNPEYDPDMEYIPREDRVEWDTVGLMGKLRVIKGQPVGSRWIKMRDISEEVEEWLVR